MSRRPVCAGLTLFALASRGEHIEAVYREGAEIVFAQTDSISMETDEARLSVNGMEIPPEAMQESGMELPSMRRTTSIRFKDSVLAAAEGRPTQVRRVFEQLAEKSVDNDGDKEKTGPLEGRSLLLEDEDGEVVVELEDDSEEGVESIHLEGHRLTHDVDLLLPDAEVAIGDTWQVEDDALREFVGLASGPVLFEKDEDDLDPLEKLLDENSAVTAEIEFAALEEREGLRCAVFAFTIAFQAELDDPTAFGADVEGMEDVTGGFELEVEGKGRLWYAMEEGRPVAMEQTFEGSMTFHFEAGMTVEGNAMQVKAELSCSVDGEGSSTWSPPE